MEKIVENADTREAHYVTDENGKFAAACGNCACYRPNPATKGRGGDCHFDPPTALVISAPGGMGPQGPIMRQNINTVFPPVPKEEMCFRFAPYAPLRGWFYEQREQEESTQHVD